MHPPFTHEQFVAVFRDYNESLWPFQLILLGVGLLAFVLALAPRRDHGVAVSLLLALLWAWTGLAYHLVFFSRINPLAFAFATLSLAGAWLFVRHGVIRRSLSFARRDGARKVVAVLLVVFALVGYPLWSSLAGLGYPSMPTFGLPCPTTLFTLGLLCLLEDPHPRSVLVIPTLWCVVGSQAAFQLGMPQDFSLVVGAAVGLVLITSARSRRGAASSLSHASRASAAQRH